MRVELRKAKVVGWFVGALSVILTLAGPLPTARAADAVYERQVRPMMAANCVRCHSGRKNKGGLDLSTREKILLGGDSGPAVAAGKPKESLLLEVLLPKGKPHMPPKKQLRPVEIASLSKWIEGLKAADVAQAGNQKNPPNKRRKREKDDDDDDDD